MKKNRIYKKIVIGSLLINSVLISNHTESRADKVEIKDNDIIAVDNKKNMETKSLDNTNIEKLENKEDKLEKKEDLSSNKEEIVSKENVVVEDEKKSKEENVVNEDESVKKKDKSLEENKKQNLDEKSNSNEADKEKNTIEDNQYEENIKAWTNSFAGNEYFNPEDKKMFDLNEKLDKSAEEFLSLVSKDSNSLWSDIKEYNESKYITQSYRRLETLAKQYSNKHSKYYKDENVKNVILQGLDWEYENNYNENSSIKGNWWDYEIGAPRAINNTLSLIYKDIDKGLVNKYVQPINHFVPNPYQFRVTTGNPFNAKGGNLIDMGRVKIIAGFLQNDSKIVDETIESLKQVYERKEVHDGPCQEGECEGFYKDGSYIDHTNIAYTGAYGNVMLDGFSQLLSAISFNTKFDNNELNSIYQIIDNSFLPLLVRTQMMDMVRGRSISREDLQTHKAGTEVIRAILRIAEVSDEDIKNRYNGIVKYLISDNDFYDYGNNLNNYRDIALYNNLSNVKMIKPQGNDIVIYNSMNKVVYRNNDKGYALGFSLNSDKIKNFEYMNGENSRGWYTSDGAVYLYNNDMSHYSDNYWATIDSYSIPSTTEIKEIRDDSTDKKFDNSEALLNSNFVGATKLGDKFSTISMDFNNWNNKIKLKKSWFIVNDKIIFLGSDINNKDKEEVFTTIENRKLTDKDQYIIYTDGEIFGDKFKNYDNLESLFLENRDNINQNIGYHFIQGNNININIEDREGSWSDINKSGKTDLRKNTFIKVKQHHNDNKGYAYLMVPAVSKDEFGKIINKKINVISNNDTAQAIYDESNNFWGISLYEDIDFKINDDLTLSKKGIYSIVKDNDGYIISFYDPTNSFNINKKLVNLDYEVIKYPQFNGDNLVIKHKYTSDTNTDIAKGEESKNHNDNDNQVINKIHKNHISRKVKINKVEDIVDNELVKIKSKDVNPKTGINSLSSYIISSILSILTLGIFRKKNK